MPHTPLLPHHPKVSVIMPSFLGDYPNAASNREDKFLRAVASFMNQTYKNCELIIVADGCEKTKHFYYTHIVPSKHPGIKYTWMDKQRQFSGAVRNCGIMIADGEIICYLDTDDILEPTHVEKIVEAWNRWGQTVEDPTFIEFDDWVITSENLIEKRRRGHEALQGRIGTSNIAHSNSIKTKWKDGYGHDWWFYQNLIVECDRYYVASEAMGYQVCHIPGQVDF